MFLGRRDLTNQTATLPLEGHTSRAERRSFPLRDVTSDLNGFKTTRAEQSTSHELSTLPWVFAYLSMLLELLRLKYIYIYTINCNWAYARWPCLQRPYIQQGNSTYISWNSIYISRKQHNTSHEFPVNTSTWISTIQYKYMNISTIQ
jgi:hypothetical protein